MSEKALPAIKGYAYVTNAAGERESVSFALWENAPGKKGFNGNFELANSEKLFVSAFRDTVKSDGSPASPKAPLKLYVSGEEDENGKRPLVEIGRLFPGKEDAKNPYISGKVEGINNGETVFVTITQGNGLVGVKEKGQEAAKGVDLEDDYDSIPF